MDHPHGSTDTLASAGQPQAGSVGPPLPPADEGEQLVAAINPGVERPAALKKTIAVPAANLWTILGVSWGVGLVLLAAQWSILRGT